MIEQQRVQITDLKEQLNSLTSSDGDNSTVALQRQIQKLNKSVKMKDEFCSILSSELKKAQDELRANKETSKDVEDSGMQEVSNVLGCTYYCGHRECFQYYFMIELW